MQKSRPSSTCKSNPPNVVTVGDRVSYTIVIEVDEGTGVALAAAGLPPEVALVDPPELKRVSLGNGREQVTMSFQLAPFVTGEILMPPFPVRYSSPEAPPASCRPRAA